MKQLPIPELNPLVNNLIKKRNDIDFMLKEINSLRKEPFRKELIIEHINEQIKLMNLL